MYPGELARSQPDKIAYRMASSGETVSYKQLDEASNRGAQLFRSLGLQAGDHVALHMENNARFFEICWAAQRAGLIYTAISSRLTASELEYIVSDSGARVYIGSHKLREVAERAAPSMANLDGRYLVGGAIDGFADWEKSIADHAPDPIADEVEGNDMLYSSGTTGRPKGVSIPFDGKPIGTPPAMLGLLQGLYGARQDSVYLSPAPLYHAAPLRFNMAMMRLGATCIVMESFDAMEALRLIEAHRVTISQWVPSMFVRMFKLTDEQRAQHDLSSLQSAIHAAAPCPLPVKEKMIDWWGPVLFEYYAGTEGNGFTTINSEEWMTHKGSVGKALLGEIHILDENGEEQPPGEPGVIYFAGGGKFEYHNDAQKTAESRTQQGWSTLGDIGYLDDEGYLYLTDRKSNMIISGGVNIYPQESENVLITHPKVADAAVFGVPNEDFGEEVKAVVQPIDMADANADLEAELLEFCQAHLAKIKCPKSIDFEAELPRHPTGKLYKRLLKDRYWGDRKSRII